MCGFPETMSPEDGPQLHVNDTLPKRLPTLLTSRKTLAGAGGKPSLAKETAGKPVGADLQAAAALAIQAAYRGSIARCQLKKRPASKEEAATRIQAFLRARAVRRSMSVSVMQSKSTAPGKEKKHRDKDKHERKQRKAAKKAAKEAIQPFLLKHGFTGVKAKRQRLWRWSYPLHVAVKEKDAEAVKLLLKAGADPDQVDSFGRTPIILAGRLDSAGSHTEVLQAFGQLLLRCNAQAPLPEMTATTTGTTGTSMV
jgi:hypothetical protein